MQNAYQRKEEFDKNGNCLRRETVIGPIVVTAIVAIVALLAGRALVTIPPTFWQFLKP